MTTEDVPGWLRRMQRRMRPVDTVFLPGDEELYKGKRERDFFKIPHDNDIVRGRKRNKPEEDLELDPEDQYGHYLGRLIRELREQNQRRQ